MEKTLPTTDRFGFPVQVCGRCCGTGKHSYNQVDGDRCYGCNGHGVRHTAKAAKEFKAWDNEVRARREALGKDIQVGDELAIIEAVGLFNTKVVGWHKVTEVVVTGEERGWTIGMDAEGNETRTANTWAMTIRFDDGEETKCCTQSCFRRRGWIDPAPYVARCTK